MDIEKLIHCLQCCARVDAHNIGCDDCGLEYCGPECQQLCGTAATALSALQTENEKLRAEVESLKKEHCAGCSVPVVEAERLRDLNEAPNLRAELEQVKMECDAAKSTLAERIGVRGAEPITTAFGLPIDRLRELAEADREGRCVVLPCKVEDDVYINILGRTLPFTVISISQMASTPTFKAQHGIRLVYIFKADDVGETVFLTRAEAEAALRREQDGNNK